MKIQKKCVLFAIALLAVVALVGGAQAQPDLNVSSITINPGDTRGEGIVRVYGNESNNISALVHNEGDANAGAFDVCFDADGIKVGCEEVSGLVAGANKTVSIDWTPTCANYPVMPGFPAQSLPITINVTADCNCTDCPTCPADGSKGKIAEPNETNNLFSMFIPAIQVYSNYDVIGGVVNNGYKSKNFDCNTTEESLTLFEYDDMYGGIAYNVSGAKISKFQPTNTSTRNHSITILSGMTVKKARLYVYWYDMWGNYKTYPTGCLANLSVNFSGTTFMPDVKYNDQKGFGYYHSPKGTYAYNVTSKVTGSGDYTVIVKNIDPNNSTTLLGEMLLVVYEDPNENNKIQLWALEGNDYLMAADAAHGSHNFGVSPEEASATVAFPGSIDLTNVSSATLVSIVAQGMATGSNMHFNGEVVKTDAWNSPSEAYPNSKINVESVDVKSYLAASGNNMAFQDNGTGGMQASNAILIVKLGKPDLNVSRITINPGDTRGEDIVRVYVNESNNISAVVWNNGTDPAGAFDVCFVSDGIKIGCEEVAGLAAGANTTVSIDWTPTCADYPVMPGFPAQSLPVTINVTADCNCIDCPTCPVDGSNGKIAEPNETNNLLSMFIPAIQVYSTYNVIGGVINNGYKSKNFDCNPSEEPLTLLEYDSEIVGGGIAYNVSGAKITLKPTNTSTRVHHIEIPDGATVKKARLYVYWYDAWGNYKTYPTGCLADLSVTLGGTEFIPEVEYNDQKGFGYYHSPKGTYAYDVTSKVTGSGDYTVIVENIDPTNKTTLLGEMLYVVYESVSGTKIQLWTLEGNDYLMQANITHPSSGGHKYSVSEEEATATVALPGSIDKAKVTNAMLVTVVAQGRTTGMDMLFNDGIVKTDAWGAGSEAYPESKICVESVDVTAYLATSGNKMGFRDTGTDGMQASNAFLVITYEEEEEIIFDTGSPINPYPSIMGTHNGTIKLAQTINVSKMYTYSCTGTGGHSEYAAFYNAITGEEIANGTWNGYQGAGDYHYIVFEKSFILEEDVTYNYTIKTGSYPQIIHEESKVVTGGTITCTKFVDANEKEYNDWIPAIRLGE